MTRARTGSRRSGLPLTRKEYNGERPEAWIMPESKSMNNFGPERRDLLLQATALVAGTTAASMLQAQPPPSTSLFEGFQVSDIPTTGATIHVLSHGQGRPLLLLHGYPQTHVI